MTADTKGTTMQGALSATGRTRRATVFAILLAMSLLAGPASGQDTTHDPSEPYRDGSSFAAQPRAAVTLDAHPFHVVPHNRVAGDTRYATAVRVSQTGWPSGARHVVIAAGETFQDALSSTSLAGVTAAPLLLATPAGLDGGTLAELERLAPDTIHLIGALPAAVAEQVAPLATDVRAIAAHDVHATSWEVSRAAIEAGADPSHVVVASAVSFADALTASALAAGLKHPLILVGPDGFADWVGHVSRDLGASTAIVVGGTAVVPDDVVSQVDSVVRLGGATRYETALAVANHLRQAGKTGPPVMVSGLGFADGLTAGVLAAHTHRAPLLLTGYGLEDSVAAWMGADATEWVRLVGGTAAVSPLVACQLSQGDTRAWLCIEQELQAQGYNTGAVDGQTDRQTVWTLYAFQKVAEIPVTGNFAERDYQAMLTRPTIAPERPDLEADRVEINIGRQLILVIRDHKVIHQLHTSTGKASTPTVRGVWRVYEMRNYRQANRMYRPVFFYRGYAFHGYPEIPLYPASAGCARTYDGDMDFLWDYMYIGEQIVTHL